MKHIFFITIPLLFSLLGIGQTKENEVPTITVSTRNENLRVREYSSKRDFVYTTSRSNSSISLWDTKTGYLIKNYVGFKGSIYRIKVSSDNKFFIAFTDDNEIIICDVKSGSIRKKFNSDYSINSNHIFDLSSDNKYLAFLKNDREGIFEIWDLEKLTLYKNLKISSKVHVDNIFFTDNNTSLLILDSDKFDENYEHSCAKLNLNTQEFYVFELKNIKYILKHPTEKANFYFIAEDQKNKTETFYSLFKYSDQDKTPSLILDTVITNEFSVKMTFGNYLNFSFDQTQIILREDRRGGKKKGYLNYEKIEDFIIIFDLKKKCMRRLPNWNGDTTTHRIIKLLNSSENSVGILTNVTNYKTINEYDFGGNKISEINLNITETRHEPIGIQQAVNSSKLYFSEYNASTIYSIDLKSGRIDTVFTSSDKFTLSRFYIHNDKLFYKPSNLKKVIHVDLKTKKEVFRYEAEEKSFLTEFDVYNDGKKILFLNCSALKSSFKVYDTDTKQFISSTITDTYFSSTGNEKYNFEGKSIPFLEKNIVVNSERGIMVLEGYKWKDNTYGNGGNRPSVEVWDIRNNRLLFSHFYDEKDFGEKRHNTWKVYSNIFLSGTGKRLLIPFDKEFVIWNTETGSESTVSNIVSGLYGDPILSKDENYIISLHDDHILRIWDVRNGSIVRSMSNCSFLSVQLTNDGKYIVCADPSGKIVFIDYNTLAIKLSVYNFPNNEYLITTPEGQFDGTEGGIKQIYYVKGLDIIPVESLYEKYYTPNLLSRVLAGEDISVLQQGNDIKNLKSPAKVKIITPRSGSGQSEETLKVTVQATDQGGGIDEIRLFLNGKLVESSQRGFKKAASAATEDVDFDVAQLTKTYTVTLSPGKNVIRATAFNKDRTESLPDEVTVELKGAEASARLFVLSVGINTYQNPKYTLNYGKPDAQAFTAELAKHSLGIFKEVVKKEIYDTEATKANIQAALNDIAAKARPTDMLVFFYAGHGVMSEGNANEPAQFYLIPTDVTQLYGNDGMLKQKAISARELMEFYKNIKAQKQLVVLDACQSGGAVEMLAMRGAAEEKAIMQLSRSAGVVVLAATGTEQFATEFQELKHGVFTYALIEALNTCTGTKDGKITVRELEAYVNDAVPELTKKYKGTAQYPNSSSRGMDFPVGVCE